MTLISLDKWSPYGLAALRMVAALLFMQHGLQKYFGFPPGGHATGQFHLFSVFGIAGTLELFGGALLLVGLATRPVAFILCGYMAVAYWTVHFIGGLSQSWGWFPVVNGGDLAILFCFTFLHLFLTGPGAWSIDGLRHAGDRKDV